MRIRSFLWLVPFFLFFFGYYIAYRLVCNEVCRVPSVIGKSTYEAVRVLSEHRLPIRIIEEREDAVLAEGTVISQKPAPQQMIKAQQSVFLVISKRPPITRMPVLLNRLEKEVENIAQSAGIHYKKIFLTSSVPKGTCIAQIPEPDAVSTGECIVYISAGNATHYILPDCTGLYAHEVCEFFKEHGIAVHIFHEHPVADTHTCTTCRVHDQRPLAGVCIDTTKISAIQVSVG